MRHWGSESGSLFLQYNFGRTAVTPRQFAELVHRAGRVGRGSMIGSAAISALKTKLRVKTDASLKQRIGISIPTIQLWKGRSQVTARQLAEIVHRARRAGVANAEATTLRPLVEFFPVVKTKSKQGKKYELFKAPLLKGKMHPYLDGLRNELKAHHGVYVFFDSRGQAIYAGKARKQNLWKEMTNAFNRKRGDIQTIRRVQHPLRRQRYRTAQEKVRQITEYAVPLHELAMYFSAYDVADRMIARVEALLVRSVANDLLNKRMETFGKPKKKK